MANFDKPHYGAITFTRNEDRARTLEQLQHKEAVSALAIDWSTGNFFTKGVTADSTFTFSNATATDKEIVVVVSVTGGSNRTMTFPATVNWTSGAAPGATTNLTSLVARFLSIGGVIYGTFTNSHATV